MQNSVYTLHRTLESLELSQQMRNPHCAISHLVVILRRFGFAVLTIQLSGLHVLDKHLVTDIYTTSHWCSEKV